jgi:colanic acid biosynthesis protein WcaH
MAWEAVLEEPRAFPGPDNFFVNYASAPSSMSQHIPENLYHEILRNIPIACVDIVIISNGCALLVKRKEPPAKNQWWIPGGRVLKGETLRDAARRKALEEVGIDCHVGPIIETSETIFPDGPSGIPIHSVNSCFLLYPIEDASKIQVVLDDNHDDCKWVRLIPEGLDAYVTRCLREAGLE